MMLSSGRTRILKINKVFKSWILKSAYLLWHVCIHHFRCRNKILLYLYTIGSISSTLLLCFSFCYFVCFIFDNSNHGNGFPQMPFATTWKINKTNRSHSKIVGLRIFAINYSIFGSVRMYALLLPVFLHISFANGFTIAAADAILNFCVALIFFRPSLLVISFTRVCMWLVKLGSFVCQYSTTYFGNFKNKHWFRAFFPLLFRRAILL